MKWLEFAKAQKVTWTEATKNRNMPPIVVASRNGEPVVSVMAPECNKYMALNAAVLVRKGFAADSIAFITDGYCVKKVATDSAEILERVQKGEVTLQELYQQGHPSIGESISAIVCDGKESQLAVVEYDIVDNQVVWRDSQEVFDGVGGFISESLMKIMKEKTVLEMELMQEAAAHCGLENDPEKQIHHASRAIRKILHMKNYLIMEWIDWNETEGFSTLVERLRKKMKDLEGVYDIDHMLALQPSVN